MHEPWIRTSLIALATLTSVAPLACAAPAWAYSGEQRQVESGSQLELRKDKKDDDDEEQLRILEFAASVELPRISLVELLAIQQGVGGNDAVEDLGHLGSLVGGAVAAGVSVVRRDLPALWRISVKGKKVLRNLDVQYRVESSDGRNGYLSMAGSADDVVGVHLLPLVPRQVDRDGKRRTIEGGAQLLLDLSKVRKAGRYEGSITIVVNRL